MAPKKKTKPKKTTPKKSEEGSQFLPALLIVGLLALIVVAALFVTQSMNKSIASVNGQDISEQELNHAYTLGVPEEQQALITKLDYLEGYVIPQKIILQQALQEGSSVTAEEIELAIEELAQSQEQSVAEFEMLVNERGVDTATFRKTMEENLIVSAYLDEHILSTIEVTQQELEQAFAQLELQGQNVTFEEAQFILTQQIQYQKAGQAYTVFVQNLVRNASIVIEPFEEELKKRFTRVGDEVCDENNQFPLIFFTSSQCESCLESATHLSSLFVASSVISLEIWELDTGDNLMTREKETGIPSKQLELFNKYNSQSTVPFSVIGCTHTHHGEFKENDRVLIYLLAQLENERRE